MDDAILFKNQYRIPSIRLRYWDYSWNGYYFITICTKNRECFFGDIVNGKMTLSNIGKIAHQYWLEIPSHFSNVQLDIFIVMPNHLHGIVIIDDDNHFDDNHPCGLRCRDAINRVSTTTMVMNRTGGITGNNNPMLNPHSLSTIIRWYKGRCTYEIHKTKSTNFFAWQPNYYESIIHTSHDLCRIRRYIQNNPRKWQSQIN